MECAAKGARTRCLGPPVRRCARCGVVAYCSLSHQIAHWSDHKQECERLEQQMRNADMVNKFPFTFSEEATVRICEKQETRCLFLERWGLHQVGMWSYECSCGPLNISLNLSGLLMYWNLSSTFAPCTEPASPLSKQLSCWKEYYEWRSIPLDSPAAVVLQWPLTIYYALQLNATKGRNDQGNKVINIHYLGPDKELNQLASFGELLALLPQCNVHIELIGPAVPERRDGQRIELDRCAHCDDKDCKCKLTSERHSSKVTLQLHRGYYHDWFGDIVKDSCPHLIIAPNAGIAAYPSWKETIVCLAQLNLYTLFETAVTRNAQTFKIHSYSG
ncbi:hypothetical protein Cgig2_013012 [Carnegiea gigantea]|uniref:MYND-type domain-containing protein n=1 Tax=Carnegiea gigantea TaxID=171969 RepID=A0A9Q1JH29_9CARY|nr:hypothetical protein Cgig2_013012 [Carnegiea gigantea]